MPQTAKLFKNGRSQAVRLPAEFRFPGKEVQIRRDEVSGEVILSPVKASEKTWQEFFDLVHQLGVPEDFMADRDQGVAEERDFF